MMVLAFAACSAGGKTEPEIKKEKFADLLIELYANEGIFSGTYNLDSASTVALVARNDRVLKKFGVTKEQFVQTYKYYDENKKELEKVYQIALDSIAARRDRLNKAR